MVKMGYGIAALLGGLILTMVGFDADNVTTTAVTGIRSFYSLLPIAGVLGAMYVMSSYDLTEEKAHEVREALERKKGLEE
jgi:GPH family glycoside/pentoside/hexuronide:cation symporter